MFFTKYSHRHFLVCLLSQRFEVLLTLEGYYFVLLNHAPPDHMSLALNFNWGVTNKTQQYPSAVFQTAFYTISPPHTKIKAC